MGCPWPWVLADPGSWLCTCSLASGNLRVEAEMVNQAGKRRIHTRKSLEHQPPLPHPVLAHLRSILLTSPSAGMELH